MSIFKRKTVFRGYVVMEKDGFVWVYNGRPKADGSNLLCSSEAKLFPSLTYKKSPMKIEIKLSSGSK